MCRGGRSWRLAALVAGTLAMSARPRPAHAIFGEEDWISGQNALLMQMLVEEIKQAAELVQLVSNVKMVLGSMNEALAVARTVKRTYEMISRYDLGQLVSDAKRGLYAAMPELREVEREANTLLENGEAASQGHGRFFSMITYHDARVSAAARRTFEHGYQAAIWPRVFPDAMAFRPEPSPVEALIQERYRWTDDARRRALQRTAMSVLASKIDALVQDAEAKDNSELRTLAADAQIELQSMENLTELRNLEEQRTVLEEAGRLGDTQFRQSLGETLGEAADRLVRP